MVEMSPLIENHYCFIYGDIALDCNETLQVRSRLIVVATVNTYTYITHKRMNIFVLDTNPAVAASYLCDKHVVKMVLETAQILCTVAHQQGFTPQYKPTHAKHPCTIWTTQSLDNWLWLVEHGKAIALEYTKRYGKVHKSQAIIEWCGELLLSLPNTGLTPFTQAMPDEYRNDDAVVAYRAYYKGSKADIATWKCDRPSWW